MPSEPPAAEAYSAEEVAKCATARFLLPPPGPEVVGRLLATLAAAERERDEARDEVAVLRVKSKAAEVERDRARNEVTRLVGTSLKQLSTNDIANHVAIEAILKAETFKKDRDRLRADLERAEVVLRQIARETQCGKARIWSNAFLTRAQPQESVPDEVYVTKCGGDAQPQPEETT